MPPETSVPRDSVSGVRVAPDARREGKVGEAKVARSAEMGMEPRGGSGGVWLVILGLKCGWRVSGKPESGDMWLRDSTGAMV